MGAGASTALDGEAIAAACGDVLLAPQCVAEPAAPLSADAGAPLESLRVHGTNGWSGISQRDSPVRTLW